MTIIALCKQAEKKKSIFPLEVSPTLGFGVVGHASLTSTSCFDSGEGPSIRVDFILTGTLNNGNGNGNDTEKKKPLPVGQKGSITISTPPWGGMWSGWSNPKQILLAYNLVGGGDADAPDGIGSSLKNFQFDVPYSGQTKELHLKILPTATPSSNGEIKGLCMNISPEENFVLDVANLMLLGVYKVHEVGYGWVFGALGGWPAVLGAVGLEEVRKVIYG